METFIALVTIVGAILQIILFFKIWGMTNNVSKILDIMRKQNTSNIVSSKQQQSSQLQPVLSPSTKEETTVEEIKYSVGDRVLYHSKELIIVGDNGDGTYVCTDTDGDPYSSSMQWQKIKRM